MFDRMVPWSTSDRILFLEWRLPFQTNIRSQVDYATIFDIRALVVTVIWFISYTLIRFIAFEVSLYLILFCIFKIFFCMHEVQCLIHRDFVQVHNSELNFQVIFIVSIWLVVSVQVGGESACRTRRLIFVWLVVTTAFLFENKFIFNNLYTADKGGSRVEKGSQKYEKGTNI